MRVGLTIWMEARVLGQRLQLQSSSVVAATFGISAIPLNSGKANAHLLSVWVRRGCPCRHLMIYSGIATGAAARHTGLTLQVSATSFFNMGDCQITVRCLTHYDTAPLLFESFFFERACCREGGLVARPRRWYKPSAQKAASAGLFNLVICGRFPSACNGWPSQAKNMILLLLLVVHLLLLQRLGSISLAPLPTLTLALERLTPASSRTLSLALAFTLALRLTLFTLRSLLCILYSYPYSCFFFLTRTVTSTLCPKPTLELTLGTTTTETNTIPAAIDVAIPFPIAIPIGYVFLVPGCLF